MIITFVNIEGIIAHIFNYNFSFLAQKRQQKKDLHVGSLYDQSLTKLAEIPPGAHSLFDVDCRLADVNI